METSDEIVCLRHYIRNLTGEPYILEERKRWFCRIDPAIESHAATRVHERLVTPKTSTPSLQNPSTSSISFKKVYNTLAPADTGTIVRAKDSINILEEENIK